MMKTGNGPMGLLLTRSGRSSGCHEILSGLDSRKRWEEREIGDCAHKFLQSILLERMEIRSWLVE